jgi:MFS family permease
LFVGQPWNVGRSIASPPATEERTISNGGVFVLALGAMDFGLEQAIVIPAIPALAREYHASLISISWLITGFLIAAIVAYPLVGRLGDLFGKRLLLLISLALFAVGSFLCAVTDSIALAIGGRVIQGLGAAVGPLTLGLARDSLPPRLLTRAIGGMVGANNAGTGLGLLLGGLLVDYFAARAIFWFLFAVALTLAVTVAALVPESPLRAKARLDFAGAALLVGGLVSLLLAISEGEAWGWSTGRIVGLFVAAACLLLAFMLVEGRVQEPLVDVALVLTRPFANANLCAFAFGLADAIAFIVIPQLAAARTATGYGLGLTATQIGLLLLPFSATGVAGGWLAGRVVDPVGPRLLVALGSLFGIAAFVSLALAHETVVALGTGSALLGLAWGFILAGVYSVVVRTAGADKTSVAAAVTFSVRNIGASVGIAAAAAIITGAGFVGPFHREVGFTRALLLGAAGAGATLLLSSFVPGPATGFERNDCARITRHGGPSLR